MNELEQLNDLRDELIARIANLRGEIAYKELELDQAQIELHSVDLRIKQTEINLRKAPAEQEPTHD